MPDLLTYLDTEDIVDPTLNTIDERRRELLAAAFISPSDPVGGIVTGLNYLQNTTIPQYGIVSVSGVAATFSGVIPIDN